MDDAALQHSIIAQLRTCLAERRIAAGMGALERIQDLFALIQPDQPGYTVLLGYLAQWVDVGFSSPQIIEAILHRFPPESRVRLSLVDYVHLRLAEGFLATRHEDYDSATRHFAFISSVEDEVRDNEMIAVSNFWTGRCFRKCGRYEEALSSTVKARDIAFGLGYPKMAAIMRITESWLLFQKGKTAEASRILDGAKTALIESDDHVALGNIESAYGRIARRQGRFDRAIDHFQQAIELYRKRDPEHPNVARSLINILEVKRLIAAQLQRRLDHEVDRRRAEKSNIAQPTGNLAQDRARLQALRADSQADLNRAAAIYSKADNHRGTATVHVMQGFLRFDNGELDCAFEEAEEAFRVAREKSDFILMSRAKILQCIIESSRFEEEIEDRADPAVHAQLACDCSRDALEFARHTENRRLLARAYVWQGLVWANEFFDNLEGARKCCDEAIALLRPEGEDYIWEDLQRLKSHILGRTRVDTVLREWSEGLVGGKTFQQVTEEFAAIVIPRVWEREARKVSRVAERLSVSPKKVRRALQAAGIFGKHGHPPDNPTSAL